MGQLIGGTLLPYIDQFRDLSLVEVFIVADICNNTCIVKSLGWGWLHSAYADKPKQ